jgi:hypothetical protein
MAADETVLSGGHFGTDEAGFAAMARWHDVSAEQGGWGFEDPTALGPPRYIAKITCANLSDSHSADRRHSEPSLRSSP